MMDVTFKVYSQISKVTRTLFCKQTGGKGKGDKENRPKVSRAKGEKRAKRTSKGLAGSQPIDLMVRQLCNASAWSNVGLHCSVTVHAEQYMLGHNELSQEYIVFSSFFLPM